MTDKDLAIVDYVKSLNSDIVEREAIFRHMREVDPEISHADVSSALRSLGYAAKRMKGSNPSGICSRWVRESKVEEPAEAEAEKTEPKSTEQIIDEVEERNEKNSSLNARLLESLKVSRDLKDAIMQRQREALVSMARQVLSLFGDDYEQQRYKP